ncbi:MAG: hypothetical protein ACWGNO_00165 [Desulfobacterales bacterium]
MADSMAIFDRLKADLDALLAATKNTTNYEPLRIEINKFIDSIRAILSLDIVLIKGTYVDFNLSIEINNLPYRAQHIWDNPSQYSDYPDGSEDAYYNFLKYLWIIFPDGKEVQLAEYIEKIEIMGR